MDEKKQGQIALCFQKTFDTDSGRIVLERLSKLCRENSPCYVDGNPYYTAYNEGKRCVILHIRRMLEMDINEERPKEAMNE